MAKVKSREEVESNGVVIELTTYEDGSQKAVVKGKKTNKKTKKDS